ncbi:MAG: hypothetical protein JF616_11775 [Fibrobacteres bacterium]|nr:hypothetical protein [Fibrobacterota bacterium]
MATFESKGDHLAVTAFDLAGRQIYSSDFRGGCKGIPEAGYELIGTKFKYDSLGNFASKWEIAPDTSRSVFTEFHGHGKGTRSTRYIYKYANLDSIVFLDSLDRVFHVDDFGGQVCINFSETYIGTLNGFYMIYSQGKPYLYDTAVRDDYSHETGKLLLRHVEKADSIIQLSYYKNGNLKSRTECKTELGAGCKTSLMNEWFESGKVSVEQKPVGSRVVHRHFFENGKTMTESFYAGTKLDSTYRSWFEDGKLNQKIEYRLGEELKNEEWDKDGKKIR